MKFSYKNKCSDKAFSDEYPIGEDKEIDLLGVVFMSYIEDLCNEKDDKDHIKEVELLYERVVTFLIEEKSK